MTSLTEKQKRFADYYIETGNMTEAAIKAGYSKKTARVIGQENLLKPAIKNYIDEKLKELEGKRVASATEVMQLLTSAMRGELEEEVVVVESIGDYCSEARVVKKKIGLKDRIKAAELIGKRHRLFTDKVQVDGLVPVMIVGEDEIED
ncbi:terminase small subunit [uncultured Fusobacterium sp.]|uniref:terminase small subunit n=1 Tax=uncultured Fusobacterium sp. TaxID=159267 RepID=UPI00261F2C2C|nr:terminase small subunit [uncultured Fusobacterium sp.]